MIVKNEARCLARCLRSVRAILDEIIIADTGSTDGTIEIASEFGAKISHFDWADDFSAARNFALDQTTGDWILVLDADEFAGEPLATEIGEFVQNPPAIGRLKIVSDFRRHGQTLRSQSFVARLFPRGARFQGRIHEQIVSPLRRVNLRGELWHDGYLETQKSGRNVKLLLAELEREPENSYLLYQLAIEYTSLDQPENAFPCLQKAFVGMKNERSVCAERRRGFSLCGDGVKKIRRRCRGHRQIGKIFGRLSGFSTRARIVLHESHPQQRRQIHRRAAGD